MNYWRRVDFRHPFEDSFFQFVPRLDPDLAQESVRHFPKESLDQIEPRAMFGRMQIAKTIGTAVQIPPRLFGNVSGMVVQDHPKCGQFGYVA